MMMIVMGKMNTKRNSKLEIKQRSEESTQGLKLRRRKTQKTQEEKVKTLAFLAAFGARTIMMTVRVNVAWEEDRLQYSGDLHRGHHSRLLPLDLSLLDRLWAPDLFFMDARDMATMAMMDEVAGLWLTANLTLMYSFMVRVTLDCQMHFHSYPFDHQTCKMMITSYEYSTGDLQLRWLGPGVTVNHRLHKHMPGYELTIATGNISSQAWCREKDCPIAPSSAAMGYLELHRRFSAHLLTLYIPSALLVGLSWASFFWPPEPVPGRTVLVVTSLLTLVSSYAAARQSSPKTDYVKAVDVWFFVCICLNIVTVFQYAAIILLRRRQKHVQQMVVQPARSGVKESKSHLERLKERERQVEIWARVILPVLFLIFNLVYWSYYLRHRKGVDEEEEEE